MAIQFYLTDAGRVAVLDANNMGLSLNLTHIAVGSSKYNAAISKNKTHLVDELGRYSLNGGSVEANSHTLRFIANIDAIVSADIFEIGLITEQGVLFALASTTENDPLIKLVNNITSILTFGFTLTEVDVSNISISVDSNTPIAINLMNQHLAHKNPHPQYVLTAALTALIEAYALDTDVQEAVNYLTNLIQQHKNASNPHPQYLLASTFGVDLPMAASIDTVIEDRNRVYGWNGQDGDTNFSIGGVRWWNSRSGTFTFKPWRAYGKFLLWFDFQPQGDGNIYVRTFNKDGVKISDVHVIEIHSTDQQAATKYVFELPKGGYAEIAYDLSVWNRNYGNGTGSIYVDDRAKSFYPVGYTSTVDFSNESGVGDEQQDDGYDIYPNYEWFYYSDALKQYIELNALATFDDPVANVPHYHRNQFTSQKNKDLWVVVEVGKQTVELPNPDYVASNTLVVRASVDEHGDVVVGIPFEMRTVSTPNNETLVYSIAYYANAVTKTITDATFPSGSLNGEHKIYVRKNST